MNSGNELRMRILETISANKNYKEREELKLRYLIKCKGTKEETQETNSTNALSFWE